MGRRGVVIVVSVAVAVALVITGIVLATRGDDKAPAAGGGFAEPSPESSPTPAAAATPAPDTCPDTVAKPFAPTHITVAKVAKRIPVIDPPRDGNNVPGIPPLTESGKHVFAYDKEQKVAPGSARGNVLLNAHTWPDGSALGNELLDGLRRDGRIVVEGKAKQKLCYRVVKRVEVLATANVPAYYSRTGTSQLAIIVCSGQRLGPGQWTKRTIWYAVPSS